MPWYKYNAARYIVSRNNEVRVHTSRAAEGKIAVHESCRHAGQVPDQQRLNATSTNKDENGQRRLRPISQPSHFVRNNDTATTVLIRPGCFNSVCFTSLLLHIRQGLYPFHIVPASPFGSFGTMVERGIKSEDCIEGTSERFRIVKRRVSDICVSGPSG